MSLSMPVGVMCVAPVMVMLWGFRFLKPLKIKEKERDGVKR